MAGAPFVMLVISAPPICPFVYHRYEDLWLNNPKELNEFFDYTFDEHFKRQTPSFLPRRDTLEYMLARNNKLGALENVKYSHNVENVKYDSILKKFIVTVKPGTSDSTEVQLFDKCIWACGMNGEAKKPKKLMDLLLGFGGKYYHSVEATENFPSDVCGKRLLLVGSSTSAEDLALRAIKHGVDHVYVCSKSGEGQACYMGSWPQAKVTKIWGV
ncbi:MAG: SidA/IucD/PvdA family monooxygenase, partial [Gaiellaceae bacterium]